MSYLKETTIRVSLISIVPVAHKMYGRATETSSCGLPRCGRILLAATTFDARLRTKEVITTSLDTLDQVRLSFHTLPSSFFMSGG
jgi:hypothetical protein